MSGPATPGAPDHAPRPRRRAAARAVGTIVGLVLLAAAGWVLASRRDDLAKALDAVAGAPGWLIAAAVLLPSLNWLLVSLSFSVLMGRYGRVGKGEMAALVGAAWLLNYLPLRPGLAGRLAYHKLVNGVSVRDAAKVTVYGMGFTAAAAGVLLLVTAGLAGNPNPWVWLAALGLPVVLVAGFVTFAGLTARSSWRPAAMLLLRYLDVLVWMARYAVVFALVGTPIGVPESAAAAAVSQAALAVPFVGNGLGLREWAIGLTAGVHPGFAAGSAGLAASPVGLAADLINRAGEVCIAVPIGLASWWFLRGRVAATGAGR